MRHSPLEAEHVALGAKLVPFGGWLMPLAYGSGTLAEHRACRGAAVVFDVSHLGTVRVEGRRSFEILQEALTNDLRKIGPGRAQYTHLLEPSDASVLDDLIVWWVEDEVFDVMPNASNTSRVQEAIGGTDTTETRAVVAVQGPQARDLLSGIAPEAAGVPRFAVGSFRWEGTTCAVAGTGYTGEDGVECALPLDVAGSFWQALIEKGAVAAGLGARDTLRLEAGLPLHGHELGPGITPLQAGLGWVVGWEKGEFRGRRPLEEERRTGVSRRLRGMLADGRQPIREGAVVRHRGQVVGSVTSGNFSPVLERGIAMGFLDTSVPIEESEQVEIELRRRSVPAQLSSPPFVGREKAASRRGVA